jgi:hypothetical protein
MANGAIRLREFATNPRLNLLERIASWLSPKITDNGRVNIAEMGNAVVALTEARLPVRIDPDSTAAPSAVFLVWRPSNSFQKVIVEKKLQSTRLSHYSEKHLRDSILAIARVFRLRGTESL